MLNMELSLLNKYPNQLFNRKYPNHFLKHYAEIRELEQTNCASLFKLKI